MKWLYKLTVAIPAGVFDTGDVQRHSEIDRPPWVRCRIGQWTLSNVHVSATFAVITKVGMVNMIGRFLVARAIEGHVDIEATFHGHWKSTYQFDITATAYGITHPVVLTFPPFSKSKLVLDLATQKGYSSR